jgi:SAM-dependent methyltransferase
MERITSCRLCRSKDIKEIIDLGKQPLANSLVKTPDEKEGFYPLSLSWCPECNLIQLNHTAEPGELFTNYVWVTSTSKTAQEHAQNLYRDILSSTQNLKGSYVLEAASNDGTFLKPFAENGYKVLGVDPAKNIAEMAVADGIPTRAQFFGVNVAEEIVREKGRAKVVMARNVLPHVANPDDFVKGLSLCLDKDGLLVIEFHYTKVIYEGLHYDSIYHEHLCYYTLKSVERLLNQFGLYVGDIKESPISGGSLILYAGKKRGKETPVVQNYRAAEKKTGVNELKSWENFAERVYNHRKQLIDILTGIVRKSGPVIGYGASARSSTLLNFCAIDTKYISIIADQNPLKHDHYTAGTHIPITSPDKVFKGRPECVFILAWNFADEIIGILKDKYKFKGRCILPLPNNPRIINIAG